jgi:hypothetical protein
MKLAKYLFMFGFLGLVIHGAWAAELVGAASVNVTSDTAANAKKMAFDEARRQIISEVLEQYADAEALHTQVMAEKASVLTNLIASSSISGERQSDTTYSANISMTLNRQAAKNWLADNSIQNWLIATDDAGDKFLLIVDAKDRLADWIQIRRTATDSGIDLDNVYMEGNQMVFVVPTTKRAAFTIWARENGWRYRGIDGNLHIFK